MQFARLLRLILHELLRGRPERSPKRHNLLGRAAKLTTRADVIIMLDSSENFSQEEFDEMKESVAELVDAGFDLAPDVARIGFVLAISSDKVAVPVALGHYEDNIDLIQQISDTQKTNDGVAIALYGLNAARQQFQLHGRENATRIVIMITNGRNRYVHALSLFP
ncbi:von Willebrand factor type A domain protein [Cooperia oncophora]